MVKMGRGSKGEPNGNDCCMGFGVGAEGSKRFWGWVTKKGCGGKRVLGKRGLNRG